MVLNLKNQIVQIQIWDELAEGEGTVVGFFTPIDRSATKTPMPCVLGWSNSQMFEQTDDVQQCVKVSFRVIIWFIIWLYDGCFCRFRDNFVVS